MFNIPAKRKNTNCYKWDNFPNTLPFGVADSDLQSSACRKACFA
ncbi:MAG TPA: hypothetical protein PK675_00790 [Clostridia bacterium]|nr:hypothetical protein [Clostridia bacterium]